MCVAYLSHRGAEMIASSSTFRSHPGRVIRDLFRLLNDVRHCTEALVYNNNPSCSLLVSGHNLCVDCQWRSLVPPLNSGANAVSASVQAPV